MESFKFDADYLERLKTGDEATRSHFFTYCEQLIAKRLRSPHHSRSVIEDVKQETFLRLWTDIRNKQIHDVEGFGAYVSNVCQTVLREAYRENLPAQTPEDYSLTNLNPSPQDDISADFTIVFDPQLSPEQIKNTLSALADYYRACGGVGLEVEFELEEVLAAELSYV